MAFSRARAAASANTIAASAARSSEPSGPSTPAPKAPAISCTAGLPGTVTSRATASRSSVRRPWLGDPPQDVGLAARNATGQAHPQQGLPRYSGTAAAAARTVFFSSSAIVSGPTPPGTGVRADATSRTDGACTSPTSA